jgi:hypothetical protein
MVVSTRPAEFFHRPALWLAALCVLVGLAPAARGEVTIDLAKYDANCQVHVERVGSDLVIAWPLTAGDAEEQGRVTLDLSGAGPLVRELAIGQGQEPPRRIVTGVDPAFYLTVGSRVVPPGKPPEKPWEVFFDNPHRRPHATHAGVMALERATVEGEGSRASVTIDSLALGPYRGSLIFTFYAGSRILRIEAAVETKEESRAIFYDAGLVSRGEPSWNRVAWLDTAGSPRDKPSQETAQAEKVRHRAILAEGEHGTLACFPPPHQFQFPRDWTDNLAFVWHGRGYQGQADLTGFGIRQNKDGGGNFVPWFNGQPGATHRLGMFLLLSSGSPDEALAETLRYTRGDRFDPLPGFTTFTSHYHMAIAVTAMEERKRGFDRRSPPDYVRMFEELGVNMVHLGEFHGDGHQQDPGPLRLPEMRAMFEECQRWSHDKLLLIPGEEVATFLGLPQEGKHAGHWMSLFPRPVYWTMQRNGEQPFVEELPEYGRVYNVGSRGDMIRLIKEERGLVWAAHPRIKASSWTPDIFRGEDFFIADYWLGGAWKAMPGDLSREKQGERVLDLLDDMANWGHKKYILGEVDVFKLESSHELFSHMNVNYVQLDRVPRFNQGWQSVLDVLRQGKFFVTTGEILIPRFTVCGLASGEAASGNSVVGSLATGEVLKLPADGQVDLSAEVRWTFPLAFAEVISGDGQKVYRERIDLSNTGPFGQQSIERQVNLTGRHWVRLEVWDVAANGAFTQPVWLEPAQ